MSDDGSIMVAQALREAAAQAVRCGGILDLQPIIGIDAVIASQEDEGAADAAKRLAVLIDPVTRQMPDGSCERCGAPAEALKDAYCAHCGRRIMRDGEDE